MDVRRYMLRFDDYYYMITYGDKFSCVSIAYSIYSYRQIDHQQFKKSGQKCGTKNTDFRAKVYCYLANYGDSIFYKRLICTVYHYYLLTCSFNYPVPSSKISSSVCCGGTSTVYLIGTVRRTRKAGWSPVNPGSTFTERSCK